jgi:protoporphyrinogen oxidase
MKTKDEHEEGKPVVVIGAGPAGLAAAYELAKKNIPVFVLEQDRQIGGLAKTVEYKGYRFDIGGHRFFTRIETVAKLWKDMLGDDFLTRPRMSRILYKGKYFHYPLKPMNVLRNVGLVTSLSVLFSYLWIKLFPIRPEISISDWVSNRFGRRLFHMFFKTYTEKVWGMPCDTISAQWAAQRIKGLSLYTAFMSIFSPKRNQDDGKIRTLISEFHYPRLGPGMMWEAFEKRIESLGGVVSCSTEISGVLHKDGAVYAVRGKQKGRELFMATSHIISTMPLRHMIHALDPPPPPEVIEAADRLRYRDFLTVVVLVDVPDLFSDNWLYIHDESVKVGRIQNFKNWSPEMVPDASKTCLGLEYFCFEGDDLWSMENDKIIELAKEEIARIGLVSPEKIIDGLVVKVPKAYPIYDNGVDDSVATVRGYLNRFKNLQQIGRNGMHKYNNMDHSMLAGILAARNFFSESYDLWSINAEDEYHE